MKTFKDLKFETHPCEKTGVYAFMKFPNGHTISVIGCPQVKGMSPFYGDGKTTFEIWCSDCDDVIGWQTPKEITERMKSLQERH